jgi:endoglucanase
MIRRLKRRSTTVSVFCLILLAVAFVVGPFQSPTVKAATHTSQATTYNYGDALAKSIYFYEEQSSGTKPSWNRVPWIGNSATTDGSDVGLDLSGGWYDAGDHVKFGLPMAYSVTTLDWGLIQYKQDYVNAGQYQYLLNNIRWATDYFVKANPSPNVLYGQVGEASADHAFWGPAEVLQQVMSRPSYKIDTSCPGSDLAGETAAALASASIIFASSDATYASTLLTHAENLYSFADNYRGIYSNCITDAQSFYTSYSGYNDELVWGALWLYLATNNSSYLTKAEAYYVNLSYQSQTNIHSYSWTMSWDDVSYGCYVLLALITGQQQYMTDAQDFLDWWTVGFNGSEVRYSPGGEAFLDVWGSLRYAANTSFLALVYADYLGSSNPLYTRYHTFAVNQINYILGSNPRNCSYMVGFGSCYPQTPHHREAHDSWDNSINDPTYERHILYGAVVGGPDTPDDSFIDNRQTYQTNEPADDYNAALTGTLARLYQEYGGTPTNSYPDKAPDNDQLYVTASINNSGSNFTEIQAHFINQTGWPATVKTNLSLRYYFTLEPGVTPSMLTLQVQYTECGNQLSGPTQYSGNIYYVTVSCAGVAIYPGGQSDYQKQVQFRITSSGAWDPTNDWSYQGVAAQGATPVEVHDMPLYDGTTQIFGNAPSTTGVTPTPTTGITPTPTAGTTPTPPLTPTVGTTPTPTPTPVRTPTPTPTVGTTPTPTPTPVRTPTPTPTVGTTPTATPTPVRTPTPTPTVGTSASCSVHYAITNQWQGGFGATFTITNTGTTAINGWSLQFSFANGQTITQLWNGTFTQSGSAVTITNLSYNGSLAPGATLTSEPGFNGSWTGTNAAPTAFTLNGSSCTVV